MHDEGVIKFEATHRRRRLEPHRHRELAGELSRWRDLLVRLGAIGQDPARYGGAGFGNLSARIGPAAARPGARAMLITGTQTGGLPTLGLDDFCLVERYDYEANRVTSVGLVEPSSETMTHGAIYDLSPSVRYVLHGHCPSLWRRARALGIPWSDERVAYGTPAMALEVLRLFRDEDLASARILAMGGHEDGIVVFGHRADETARRLVGWLAVAEGEAFASPSA